MKCECFAGAVSYCNFALCVATKLAWVGHVFRLVCRTLASPTAWPGNEEAMQKIANEF